MGSKFSFIFVKISFMVPFYTSLGDQYLSYDFWKFSRIYAPIPVPNSHLNLISMFFCVWVGLSNEDQYKYGPQALFCDSPKAYRRCSIQQVFFWRLFMGIGSGATGKFIYHLSHSRENNLKFKVFRKRLCRDSYFWGASDHSSLHVTGPSFFPTAVLSSSFLPSLLLLLLVPLKFLITAPSHFLSHTHPPFTLSSPVR